VSGTASRRLNTTRLQRYGRIDRQVPSPTSNDTLLCRPACRAPAQLRPLDRRHPVPLPTVPRYDVDASGQPDFDTLYTRCPSCGLVATSSYANYTLTPDGDLDPAHPIALTCPVGGHPYTVTMSAVLDRDTVRTCARQGCDMVIACPSAADQVVCPDCRLHQPGPFLALDPERVDYVDQVEDDFDARVRARLRRARGEQP
jgi:hypothetical protein